MIRIVLGLRLAGCLSTAALEELMRNPLAHLFPTGTPFMVWWLMGIVRCQPADNGISTLMFKVSFGAGFCQGTLLQGVMIYKWQQLTALRNAEPWVTLAGCQPSCCSTEEA
jgi:hypothetical protein